MPTQELTIEDLRRILREAAGEVESVDLDGDILDSTFEELGYDSLALLETGSRIEREYGIALEETSVADVETPGALLEVVNKQLATEHAA
ncbi:acyl carrier protein [Streptomyces specialis]|uniref:acyl carrier protein n=1 Tax=Streptomyces specialis TaxID=498367 RepID=UPI00073E3966|nr:acyl carrier protein [Streptomyces specialis]